MIEDLLLDKGGEKWMHARPVVGLGAAFIGKTIKVHWPPLKFAPGAGGSDFTGVWYEAIILKYNEDEETHTVRYPEDDVVEDLLLDTEAWRYA